VWSVTSYKELYKDAINISRLNMLHPGEEQQPYVSKLLSQERGVFIAASDYLKALPGSIAKWIPGEYVILGTDGFGRSDGRSQLRNFFEIDARYITVSALGALAKSGKLKIDVVKKAIKEMEINPDKLNPQIS
ncbi:MAG: transketolase-like TK C-terminal-containing protein, partial [Ignavibacteria bacterium]